MARKKDNDAPAGKTLRITAPRKGFRRAGRLWQGVTEISVDELTAEQIKKLKAEPKLAIEEI
jgi:hypothetical protein